MVMNPYNLMWELNVGTLAYYVTKNNVIQRRISKINPDTRSQPYPPWRLRLK
jgi:hypothetical protein